MSFYALEAQLDQIQQSSTLASLSTSILTIVAGFVVTAVGASIVISAGYLTFSYMALAFLKAIFIGFMMVIGASVIASIFESLTMRRINSFILGSLFGLFLVLVSL